MSQATEAAQMQKGSCSPKRRSRPIETRRVRQAHRISRIGRSANLFRCVGIFPIAHASPVTSRKAIRYGIAVTEVMVAKTRFTTLISDTPEVFETGPFLQDSERAWTAGQPPRNKKGRPSDPKK